MLRSVKLYVPLFVITLILSAFLLFSVQPMFGKMVLPLLGGTPGVWNTAMVFFQAMLLGGYAYAHMTTKFLNVRMQALLHIALLTICVFVLPVAIPEQWANPPVTENPIPWLLGLMFVTIGGPFFVLAGTAPMLQRWFSTTDHPDAQNPYFLYAASNIGSMAALLSYPFAIEPLMGVIEQSDFWMAGFILLIGLIAVTGLLNRAPLTAMADTRGPTPAMAPTNLMRLRWLVLSFIPSSLMLGVTTYITTDVASAPLFWILPLALYLLTFIIVFSRHSKLQLSTVYERQAFAVILITLFFIYDPLMIKAVGVCLHLAAFFFCALTCHLALANHRPSPRHLTEFYLIMSLGGVMGGIFNSLLAPFVFTIPLEYALILFVSMLAPYIAGDIRFRIKDVLSDYKFVILGVVAAILAATIGGSVFITSVMMSLILLSLMILKRGSAFIVTLCVVMIINPGFSWNELTKTLYMERNFFGVIRVVNSDGGGMRMLMHGTTLHGTQALSDKYKMVPLSYFSAEGPGGQTFGMLTKARGQTPQTIAVIGLGLGSTACYPQPGRDYVFYEIDPAIQRVAEDKNLFTYLSGCGSPYQIILGDGRLKMAAAPDHSYDMIFLDAFSSDSIPAHLLTKEAFELYFKKLKPDGLIVVHISNRFMDLSPLVAAIGNDLGADVRFNTRAGVRIAPPDVITQQSIYGLMTKDKELMSMIDRDFVQWRTYDGKSIEPWTDDYANILYLMWLRITPSLPWLAD